MIILDIETSGTNPWKHSILSIGAVDFLDLKRTFSRECQIRPGAHISEEGLAVNGFSREEIADPRKETEEKIVADFFAWAMESRDHTIAGQNPSFDVSFLQAAAENYGLNFPLAHRTIDLHSVCAMHMIKRGLPFPIEHNRSNLNSDSIMEYVGLPAEPKPHIAFNGAKWEAEAFSRLFYNKPLFEEFKEYKIPWIS